MGTVTGREYAITIPIEPGDTQARVIVVVPSSCSAPPRMRVVVKREGLADISEDLVVEAAA